MLLLSFIVKIFFRSCFFIPGLHCGVQQQQAACRQPRLVAAPPGRGRACGDVLVLTPLPQLPASSLTGKFPASAFPGSWWLLPRRCTAGFNRLNRTIDSLLWCWLLGRTATSPAHAAAQSRPQTFLMHSDTDMRR